MKRIVTIVLALLLCLSLCACGADKNVAGDYECVGFYAGTVYRLTEDGTYDDVTPASVIFGEEVLEDEAFREEIELFNSYRDKGTYEIVEDGFKLTSADGVRSITFREIQDSYYTCWDSRAGYSMTFEKDNDYGKVPTFSKDGKCSQEFEYRDYGKDIVYVFTLQEDGTFLWSEYDLDDYLREFAITTFEGTYSLDGSVLTLTSPEQTLIFLYANDTIYTEVYKKVA